MAAKITCTASTFHNLTERPLHACMLIQCILSVEPPVGYAESSKGSRPNRFVQ